MSEPIEARGIEYWLSFWNEVMFQRCPDTLLLANNGTSPEDIEITAGVYLRAHELAEKSVLLEQAGESGMRAESV